MSGEDEPAGTVTIGMNKQPICVPVYYYSTGQIIEASEEGIILSRISCAQQFTIWCCGKSQLCYF